jgi:hypothetical protein
LVLVSIVYVAAFVCWALLSDAWHGPQSIPNLIILFIGLGIALVWILPFVPWVAVLASTLFLFSGWMVRLRRWPTVSPVENISSDHLRRAVTRQSIVGECALAIATILCALGWSAY